MRRPASVAVAGAVVLAALLTGCGRDTPTTGATHRPHAGPTARAALTTGTFADTVVAAATDAVSVDFTLAKAAPGRGLQVQGSVDFGDLPAIDLFLNDGGGGDPVELREIGDATYASLGDATGGKFFVVDEDESDPRVVLAERVVGEVDPASLVDLLSLAITRVTTAGEPMKLDVGPAQPYDVVVTTAQLPPEAADPALPATVTYRFWVTADGLVRQETWTLDGVRTTVRFTNWDKGAPIEAPTADQLTAAPS